MRKLLLLFILFAVVAWRYGGAKEVIIEKIEVNIITMTNGSQWLVYEEDMYRAKKWEKGDIIKLIYSKGFFYYDFLALNKTKEDVVHFKCVGDGR
jgi:hypothetical protein